MYESTDKMVSHPDHYQSENGMEVINVIEAFTAGLTGVEAYDAGNIIKYACRWPKKNGIQDLEKIIWYATHLVEHLKRKQEEQDEPREYAFGEMFTNDYLVKHLLKRYCEYHQDGKLHSDILESGKQYEVDYHPTIKNTIVISLMDVNKTLPDEYFTYNHSNKWQAWTNDNGDN